jgi:very-short-patch-repair endonuclease
MGEPFVGSEALARGDIVESALRARYEKVFRDVYVSPGTELTPEVRARAGWLWSRRRGIIAGLSASALHGAKWVDAFAPVELLHTNRNPQQGLLVRGDRIAKDEFQLLDGIPVTNVARTALDLACWYPTAEAVAAIDALGRAVELQMADVEMLAQRYRGRRGIRRARKALELSDAGAQSPKETWLRLVLTQAGLPRPQTQIPVSDEFGDAIAYLDMGWEDLKVAVEYDGDHHRSDRAQYRWDLRRMEMLQRLGWIIVRVVVGDRPAEIIARVRAALARRESRYCDAQRRQPRWRDARRLRA